MFLTVLAFALLPAAGNFAGALLAESIRTPKWLVGAALHSAAGIAIAVVSVELMPRVIPATPAWIVVTGFLLGALFSVALARLVRSKSRSTMAWMVYAAVGADLFSDGLMTGVGSAVAGGLGLLIAITQLMANVPGGFAATANLRSDGVSRKFRLLMSGSLVVPVLASAVLGYWLLRDAGDLSQNAALSFISGVLLVTTVEDVLPEGDAPQPSRWLSTSAFAGGFVLLVLLSTYFGG